MTQVLALSGGMGGARLAVGLQHVLPLGELTVAVNTGSDFEHLGLSLAPDLDTMLYTLSGLENPELGWGRAGDSWHFMAEIERLGGEGWYRLGDKDLAVQIERTRRLNAGEKLSGIVADLARHLGILGKVVPMTNDLVRTMLFTSEDTLDYQQYFVARRREPTVSGLAYAGAEDAQLPPAIREAVQDPALKAIVICPSNPWLSIAPILEIPAWREALHEAAAPVIAVSPLLNGQSLRGPVTKLMGELQLELGSASIARFYEGIIDGFVLDKAEAELAPQIGVASHLTATALKTPADRQRLAREVLEFAQSFRNVGL